LRIIILLFAAFLSFKCFAQEQYGIDVTKFYKPAENPVIKADSSFVFNDPIKKIEVHWQKADVFNPAAIVKDNKLYLLYRCEDNPAAAIGGRTSRLGLAMSEDGIHFKKYPTPVLFPDNDAFKQYEFPGGCEDPRLVATSNGTYIVTYTAWDNKTARLCIAFSKDLIHWQKKGPAFAKFQQGKYLNTWSKSASMITHFVNGKQVVVRINGKYWMYWGENFINLAWSTNLFDWNPLLDEKGNLKAIVSPRSGKFDSQLTECGPPAIVTGKGIVLFYNGKNATDEKADPSLPKGTYAVGQIIFDSDDPARVLERSDHCFLKPTLPHEVTGQYHAGTTFAEGLVLFKRKWLLYYGTADSFVGLAVSE